MSYDALATKPTDELVARILDEGQARTRDEAVLAAEVRSLRAGADPTPREEGAWLMPGQWIQKFLDAGAELRLQMATRVILNSEEASNCFQMDHEGLEAEAERLRVQVARVFAIHLDGGGFCVGCYEAGGEDGAPSWPCKTMQALGVDAL